MHPRRDNRSNKKSHQKLTPKSNASCSNRYHIPMTIPILFDRANITFEFLRLDSNELLN